ncbi:MAG: isoleucine--tRNA ligase, partial [Candidatus Riflebacteria bacterium]|nr:isoleucine--tRNA ligase [Candidatus Riflebacteria bacterium]
PHCETALAEAEIEYQDHRSASIFVRFEVRPETMGAELAAAVAGRRLFMAIWTTTPWTLPGNVAIALHPTHAYGVYEAGADLLIVARELAPRVADRTHLELKGPLATFPGAAFSGLLARHPFLDRDSRVVTNEKHVTLDEGTGAVHIAPGHGQEDHEIGLEHKLPILSPVDGKGRMTAESGPFGGLFYEKANARICDHLRQKEALLGEEEVDHSYPHCWRCKNPVIFRASLQWFVSVDRRDVRKRALEAIEQVRWVPTVGIKRIGGMLETRPDWCISRQRVWGVPIPAFYCQDCERETLDAAVIRHVASKVATEGSTLWWSREARDLLPPAAACRHCGSQRLRKETDIMDVWFDSGVSHASVLTTRPDQSWPADLYLEGSDQHRGWFQTSLLTSVAALDAAPYRQVLTHGFVVDEAGRKMSKSLGNVIVPQELTRELGADILRLWVASSDYTTDIKASKKILQQCTDMYRRVRNTLRFMLGNTSDFDPTRHAVGVDQMEELDRWALALLADAVEKAHEHYEHYRFYLVLHLLHNLCAVELSSFYLDILKDRLYCSAPGSRERRSAQTALYHWLRALIQMLAPIMSFTAEESFALVNWQGEKPASVFLTSWPRVEEDWKDPMLLARWEHLMAFKKGASKALELAREKKVIGSSLEALLSVYVPDQALAHDVEHNLRQFEEVCIVSRLRLVASAVEVSRDERLEEPESSEFVPGVVFGVTRAGGNKCQRCWK